MRTERRKSDHEKPRCRLTRSGQIGIPMPRSTGNGQSTRPSSSPTGALSGTYGVSIHCDSFSVRILCGEDGELSKLMLSQRGGQSKGTRGKNKNSFKFNLFWLQIWVQGDLWVQIDIFVRSVHPVLFAFRQLYSPTLLKPTNCLDSFRVFQLLLLFVSKRSYSISHFWSSHLFFWLEL